MYKEPRNAGRVELEELGRVLLRQVSEDAGNLGHALLARRGDGHWDESLVACSKR